MKGNYPFAVLHIARTLSTREAVEYAQTVSKEKMTKREAAEYVRACVITQGHPQLLDLYEKESV